VGEEVFRVGVEKLCETLKARNAGILRRLDALNSRNSSTLKRLEVFGEEISREETESLLLEHEICILDGEINILKRDIPPGNLDILHIRSRRLDDIRSHNEAIKKEIDTLKERKNLLLAGLESNVITRVEEMRNRIRRGGLFFDFNDDTQEQFDHLVKLDRMLDALEERSHNVSIRLAGMQNQFEDMNARKKDINVALRTPPVKEGIASLEGCIVDLFRAIEADIDHPIPSHNEEVIAKMKRELDNLAERNINMIREVEDVKDNDNVIVCLRYEQHDIKHMGDCIAYLGQVISIRENVIALKRHIDNLLRIQIPEDGHVLTLPSNEAFDEVRKELGVLREGNESIIKQLGNNNYLKGYLTSNQREIKHIEEVIDQRVEFTELMMPIRNGIMSLNEQIRDHDLVDEIRKQCSALENTARTVNESNVLPEIKSYVMAYLFNSQMEMDRIKGEVHNLENHKSCEMTIRLIQDYIILDEMIIRLKEEIVHKQDKVIRLQEEKVHKQNEVIRLQEEIIIVCVLSFLVGISGFFLWKYLK